MTDVLITGAAQLTCRPKKPGPLVTHEPADIMAAVLTAALGESGIDPEEGVDLLCVSPPLAWGYHDLGAEIAQRTGCWPRDTIIALPGGNAPVDLLLQATQAIASGRARIAAVVGGESMYSRRRARKEGIALDWTPFEGSRDLVGDQRPITNTLEERHGLFAPRQLFPLLENAMRVRRGHSVDAHQAYIATILARNSTVAADNPHAWFPTAYTVDDLLSDSPENRMICFPYTRLMNAVMEVDMSAALIVMSQDEADRRNIPMTSRTVITACAAANDAWTPSERQDLATSPALEAIASSLTADTGLAAEEVDLWDLYSCFPVAIQLAADAFGLDVISGPPLTVTGGLAYAGGPGNSYAAHSLATMHHRLAGSSSTGIVTALGNVAGKHAGAALAGPLAPGARTHEPRRLEVETHGPVLVPYPTGSATLETSTVEYARDGSIDRAVVFARLPRGERTIALMEPTAEVISVLTREQSSGRRLDLLPGIGNGPNHAHLAD